MISDLFARVCVLSIDRDWQNKWNPKRFTPKSSCTSVHVSLFNMLSVADTPERVTGFLRQAAVKRYIASSEGTQRSQYPSAASEMQNMMNL